MESSSSGSLKRARAPGSGNQVPSCLVDGCTADLSKCRDYHRRHKVCEVHSKTPKVTIRGQEQRFCQQCSRFHSLVEFDEGKRSCRKRLDGHNRRRRKPRPDSLSITSGGPRFVPLNRPHIFSTTALTSAWVGTIKAETNMHSELNFSSRNNLFPGSSSHNYKGEKQFPFLHPSSTLTAVSACQPFLDPNSSPGNGGSSRRMFSTGLNQVINSNRALSLLSSPPTETREIGLSSMGHPDQQQSLIPNLHYNGLGMEGEQVGSFLSFDGSTSNTNLHPHGPDLFRSQHHGSSATSTHQTLSFSWK
ncbi:hypothetical protein SLEP1_g6476 [Rubroshorea leprosula]|uniref:SBP-type domain-containing protein n=1 Tax=Rubroshorea leprosula TaxID=152421 RepID=A0AAV5I645_9ROSI|nr:hypothetical protein SLEP1_g6476 [Rubroshorea leprosula]